MKKRIHVRFMASSIHVVDAQKGAIMAKNNALINAMKAFRIQLDVMLPKIYASIALALYSELQLDNDTIERIFAKSQELWQISDELNDNGDFILKRCEEVTGLNIKYGVNSKEGQWHESE